LVHNSGADKAQPFDIGALTTGSLSAADEDTEPVRMLLVEDNEDDVFLTRRAFRVAAPHVTIDSAKDAQQAMQNSSQAQYDVAVVDYQLPDLSGMDVLYHLTALDVPVIMVTGRGDEKVAVQALKAGAVDYLVKDEGYLRRLPQASLVAAERSRLSRENRKLIAETARQASLLEAVLESDPGAIVVLRGPALILELANPSFRKLVTAFDIREGLGKPIAEVFPDYFDSTLGEALMSVFTGGNSFQIEDMGFPSPDGVQRYFKMHMLPLNANAADTERGVVVIMWETTEAVNARKRIEELAEQAAAQRDWLQGVIDQLPEGVHIATAPDANLLLVNRAAIEILGPHPVANLSRGDVPQVYGLFEPDGTSPSVEDLPLQRALWSGEAIIGKELRHMRADGHAVDLLVNAAPLYNAEGKVVAGVAVFQDITRLKDVDRLKDEFMSVASHELRTPLTNIYAASQLLLKRVKQGVYPQGEVSLINTIAQQTDRMARLIDELLDVSRLQSGRLQIQVAPFDLVALAREVVEHNRLGNPNVAFDLKAKGAVWIEADRDRIAQVLGNLLDNAVKYHAAGDDARIEVAITGLPKGKVARMEIRDNGVGFDPAKSEQIFERFSRLGSVTHHSRGMGLGLFICRELVTAHGGTISAYSPGPGRGATFTVDLSLAES
jgi:signal transduction histidine kinase/FixJ family two-component response regulator